MVLRAEGQAYYVYIVVGVSKASPNSKCRMGCSTGFVYMTLVCAPCTVYILNAAIIIFVTSGQTGHIIHSNYPKCASLPLNTIL